VSDTPLTVLASVPAGARAQVKEMHERAEQARVGARLAEQDATLWGAPGTPEVANRLGWLTIAERMLENIEEVETFAREVAAEGFADVVLLGMGGSSLAPEVLRLAFGSKAGHPRMHVLDSTDAATILSVQAAIDLQRTLFIVSSKSGGTIEPLSLFAHFNSLVTEGASFAAITDPGSGLEQLAREHGFRHIFSGDPDIGGRYSALSPFGIVPAALMGVDVRGLLNGAARAWETTLTGAGENDGAPAGVWLGAALSAMAASGRDKLTFVTPASLPGLGLWLEQLVAESTGKHGKGILPVADEPLGEPDSYGEDRVFAHLSDTGAPDEAVEERMAQLAAAGHPVITVPTSGPPDLGRVFMLAEIAVAVAGWGLEINPFDQPNVQQAKDATKQVLQGFESTGTLPTVAGAAEEQLHSLLSGCHPPHYLAIMAYVEPSADFDAAIGELREAILHATQSASTFGYGPRFLHSTGQFHKGGPPVGRFLQLVHDGPSDVQIPGAPYGFATLKEAQAIGDLQTLRGLGLPAERVRLHGADPADALRALTRSFKTAAAGN